MIQLCVQDDQGVSQFMNMMRSIAVSERMTFVDGSAQAQRGLKDTGAQFEKLDTPGSVVHIGIDRGGHTLMMGGNLGLPTYQVALGFSGADNTEDVLRFADRVVKKLETTWPVQTVPAGTGALPMKTCPGKI
jgi:hypothetical protein